MPITQQAATNWAQEWFEIEDATYLDVAAHAVMPRVALRALQTALEAKKFPHRVDYSSFFATPNRIRSSLAELIGASPEEIALTTGASSGLAVVAHGLNWTAGDEIVTAQGEFPMQHAVWKPMEEREGIKLKIVAPRDRFITADDLIAAMTPKTRIVSVSHVRFDDGSLLDAARVGAACRAQGALLVLDVSQSCGGVPLNVNELGADFMVCAGYKYLLGPWGTGFFWVMREHLANLRRGPFYWLGQDAESFSALNFVDPKPARGAKRWDAPQCTSFNLNLAAMDASVSFVLSTGPKLIYQRNQELIQRLFEILPDSCLPASPIDPARRGSSGCFTARTPQQTKSLYQALRKQNVIVSMREGKIRVSPHLFNSEPDIERLIGIVNEWTPGQ
jgi:selenocysteine lyase/cysteine desulfurase